MILKDINLKIEALQGKNSAIKTGAVENLFIKKIKKKVITKNVSKVNIYLTSEKEFTIGETIANVVDCFVFFDLEHYNNLSQNNDKKLMLLDATLFALLKCSEEFDWNKDAFLDAYNECGNVELKNEWWFKNKLFKSPDGRFYVGLYNVFDLDGYTVFLFVHDNHKSEISRRIVFKDNDPSFQWNGLPGRERMTHFTLSSVHQKKYFL